MPKQDEPMPSLEALQRKIDEAKKSSGDKKTDAAGSQDQGAGSALQLGTELVAGVAVGSVIGYGIDRWLGTMPLFFVICFFVGAAAGFRNMIRQATKDMSKDDTKTL